MSTITSTRFNCYSSTFRLFGIYFFYSVFILLLNINESIQFNLENRLPIIKFEKGDTYFGYSIAAHTINDNNNEPKSRILLVGAPLGQNLQPQTNHSGALFQCPITQNDSDCIQITTDGRRYDSNKLEPPLQGREIKDGQWLGVTVRSHGLNSKVLVCAHRYITTSKSYLAQGLCYILTNDLQFDDVIEPCQGKSVVRAHEEYSLCQVGTSGILLDDGSMILGAPGPYTWRGTIFVKDIAGEYLTRNKNVYNSDHSDKSSPVGKYSYLGMAVTGGTYFGEKMSYVAGAPRSNGTGEVVIFTKSDSSILPTEKKLRGEQFASSFGYELATADVNGDNLPDLLVSAPFYFDKTEGGAVYIYQNYDNTLPSTPTLKLTGKLESRFGIALASLGDINKDSCDDIAIGAPYEEEGVVYIYLGSPTGLTKKPSQIIKSSDLGGQHSQISTFGSSLSGGVDLDGNEYPDLAIGAYASSAVVMLLARPIKNIETEVIGNELMNIDPNKSGCSADPTSNLTCFSFEACCSIDQFENIQSKSLNITYTIEAETFSGAKKFSRVYFENGGQRSNIIKRKIEIQTERRKFCKSEVAYIKEKTRDIQTPIKFRLNYTLDEPELPLSGLQYLHPILDQRQADRVFEGTFHRDCGGICESKIELATEIHLQQEHGKYILNLGESEELRLHINLTNVADSAYEAQLFIVYHKSIAYIGTTKSSTTHCNRFNDTMVACNLGNPMPRDQLKRIEIRFDPRQLGDSEAKLSFRVFANTTSKLIGTVPDKTIDVQVVRKVRLIIQGRTVPEQLFYGGEVKGESAMEHFEDIGTSVLHSYNIFNEGPWKAPHVFVEILWPHQVANDKVQGKWLLYLEELPIVEGSAKGACSISQGIVNPLKLKSRERMASLLSTDIPPETLKYRSTNKTSSYTSEKFSTSKFSHNSESTLNRVKRDQAKVIRAERYTDKDGKETDVVVMDCKKNTAFCIKIECNLYNLPRSGEAFIHVKARLWNATLVSDYPRVDLVKIVSRAKVNLSNQYGVQLIKSDNEVAIESRAYPELLDQARDTPTPIWIIIVAVICGLIVLAILAWAMWKCGFFKRKKFDPTLSGNLEKNNENKPFLNN